MKPPESNSVPTREDFGIEEFGGEALIVRLADMRLFRVNKQTLELFEMFLETKCDSVAAAVIVKEQYTDLDSMDIDSIQKILFPPEKDLEELHL